jgi:hypothetical protein
MANKFTRRRLLTALGAGAISVALANTLGCKVLERTPKVTPLPEDASSASAKGVWAFRSRPELGPPFVEVTTLAQQETAPGYIFVASKKGGSGPGVNLSSMDFKVQHYRGEPVLTLHTWGKGEYGILDSSYREIARLRAGNGYRGDHHEFLITPQDTALITIYNPVPWDLSRLGGSKDSIVYEGVVQELDIESGEVLFEWHSLEHVGLEESYVTPSEDGRPGLDYFHINSIDVDHDATPSPSTRSSATAARSCGAWAAKGATSRWVRVPPSPTSTTLDANQTVPSPSSITATLPSMKAASPRRSRSRAA